MLIKEERQEMLHDLKQHLDEKQTQDARTIVKNLREDQILYNVSVYRQLSQPLHTAEWWQKKRQKASAAEQAELTALQQQWQAIMPFAFCTSEDLIEKVKIVEELDAYLWLAQQDFKVAKIDLPLAFREKYQQWLNEFSQVLLQVKYAMAGTMLGILRAVAITGDLTCNTMMNTEVIPILKQLGILVPHTSSLMLPGALDAKQFAGLVTFIQSHGTKEQQKALAQLSLFEWRVHDKCPLLLIPTLTGHFISVPHILKKYFTPTAILLSWLPAALRLDRRYQEHCFGMETTYHLLLLNQRLYHVEQQLTFPQDRSLVTQVKALQALEDAQKQLQDVKSSVLTISGHGVLKLGFIVILAT